MPENIQLFNVIWGVGTGLLTVFVIWLIISNAWWRKPMDVLPDTDESLRPPPAGEVHEYGEDLAEAHGRATTYIKVLAVAYVIWTIGYIALTIAEHGFNAI